MKKVPRCSNRRCDTILRKESICCPDSSKRGKYRHILSAHPLSAPVAANGISRYHNLWLQLVFCTRKADQSDATKHSYDGHISLLGRCVLPRSLSTANRHSPHTLP